MPENVMPQVTHVQKDNNNNKKTVKNQSYNHRRENKQEVKQDLKHRGEMFHLKTGKTRKAKQDCGNCSKLEKKRVKSTNYDRYSHR